MEITSENISLYSCQFQMHAQKANIQIKFPCNYFLQWKSNNKKVMVTSKNRYQANKCQIIFKENLTLKLNVLYDKINKKHLKKQSILMINLISKSKPDQIKLVGRVAIDLAEVLNMKKFNQMTPTHLQYCSVEATINFSIRTISIKQSVIHESQLDRSSLNQCMTLQASLKPHEKLVFYNQESNTHRDFDQSRSQKSLQQRQIKSLGRDRNKLGRQSLIKQVHTPINRTSNRNQTVFVQAQNKINRSKVLQRSNSIPNQLQNQHKLMSPQSQENQSNFSFHRHTDSQQQIKIPTNNYVEAFKFSEINRKKENDEIKQVNLAIRTREIDDMKQINLTIKRQNIIQIIKNQAIKTPTLKAHTIGQQKQRVQQQKALTQSNGTEVKLQINQLRANNLSIVQKRMFQSIGQKVRPYEDVSTLRDQDKGQLVMLQGQIKQKQLQQFIRKISEYQIAISQKDAAIRIFQNQIQGLKRAPLVTKIQNQIQKSKQQSKNILSLTQALNQWENKYTKATLQNEWSRNNWKREKEDLLRVVSKWENVADVKQEQIKEKNKLYQVLNYNFVMLEQENNQKLGEIVWLRSQIVNMTVQNQKLITSKNKTQLKIEKLQSQINLLNQFNTQNNNQLNKSLAQKLSMYESQINTLQTQIQEQRRSKAQFIIEIEQVKMRREQDEKKIIIFYEESVTLNSQLQNARQEISRLSEEKQQLELQLQEKNKQILQTIQTTLLTKNEQIDRYFQQKQRQIARLKQQKQAQINGAKQQSEQYRKMQENTEKQLISKTQNLEDTILSLSDQVIEYQFQLKKLRQKLQYLTVQLNSFRQSQQSLSDLSQQQRRQRQQLILSLKSQLEQQSLLMSGQQMQIHELKGIIAQKDQQLIKHLKQFQSIKHQLDITKAKTQIYQKKVIQLESYYQQQAENLKMQQAQRIYHMENQLQQELQKSDELGRVREMLSRSVQNWQDKCTQDKISSSRAIGELNDIIKQKQEVMDQMQCIMKTLQKDKHQMQQKIESQNTKYQQMVCKLRSKQTQIRQTVQKLYLQFQQVRKQRDQSNMKVLGQSQIITGLKSGLLQQGARMQELARVIQSIKTQLQVSQCSFTELRSRSSQQLQSIANEHNQQLEEYQERIKQLQSIIIEKDGQILSKQIMITDQERQSQSLAEHSQNNIKFIQALQQLNQEGRIQLQSLRLDKNNLQNQFKKMSKNLQEIVQKYFQLQNSLIESEDRFKQAARGMQDQRNQLISQAKALQSKLNEQAQMHNQTENNHNWTVHNLTILNSQQIQQLRNKQAVKQQQLMARIKTLQEQSIRQNEQQMQKLQSQIKHHQKLNLELKSQAGKVPSLQRTIQMKSIQLNSLKQKLDRNTYTQKPAGPDQVFKTQEILKIKNKEIQALKMKYKEIQTIKKETIKELQLQLYQVQLLNQALHLDLQQCEEQKFNMNSGHNQKEIRIAELQEQVQILSKSKGQLSQKNLQITNKMSYYQNIIIDFKGHQRTSTSSHSQKMNTSGVSSIKVVQGQIDNIHKIQVQTLRKEIRFLQNQIQMFKIKQEEFKAKEKQMKLQINFLQETIEQKQLELVGRAEFVVGKLPLTPRQQKTQFRIPQQATQICKQIRGILKERSELHNLQNTLIKIMSNNEDFAKQIEQNQQDKKQEDYIFMQLNAKMNNLSMQFLAVKTRIMKLEGRNYQEKAKIITMLKPCELGIKQIIWFIEDKNQFKESKNQI